MSAFRTIDSIRFPIGGFGGSLVFDGSNDFATIPDIVPSVAGFSWSCWVKMANDSPAFGRIFDYYDDTRGTRLLYDSTVNNRFNFDVANGTVISAVTPGNYRKLNNWVHFMGIYNGTTLSLYQNNQLIQTQTKTMTAPTAAQLLTLGKASGAASSYGKFAVAHFAWDNDNVWTEDERASAYYQGQFPESASWYDFLENSEDQSDNGNDMTIDGAVYSEDAPFSTPRPVATSRPILDELSSGNFNSASGRILITDSSHLYNNEFTYCGYIKPENDGTNRVIVGWSQNSNPQFSLGTANQLRLVKQNVAGIAITTRTLLAGRWYYVAVTYAANGDYRLYVGDKKSLADLAASGNAVQTWNYPGATMYIGNVVGFGQAFRGLGRSFKFFNRALSLAEVRQARMENSYNTLDGCVAHIQLNDESGAVATDSISGKDGAMTNVAFSTEVLFPPRTAV